MSMQVWKPLQSCIMQECLHHVLILPTVSKQCNSLHTCMHRQYLSLLWKHTCTCIYDVHVQWHVQCHVQYVSKRSCQFCLPFCHCDAKPFARSRSIFSIVPFCRFTVPFYRFIVLPEVTERVETAGECLKVHTVNRWSVAWQLCGAAQGAAHSHLSAAAHDIRSQRLEWTWLWLQIYDLSSSTSTHISGWVRRPERACEWHQMNGNFRCCSVFWQNAVWTERANGKRYWQLFLTCTIYLFSSRSHNNE